MGDLIILTLGVGAFGWVCVITAFLISEIGSVGKDRG